MLGVHCHSGGGTKGLSAVSARQWCCGREADVLLPLPHIQTALMQSATGVLAAAGRLTVQGEEVCMDLNSDAVDHAVLLDHGVMDVTHPQVRTALASSLRHEGVYLRACLVHSCIRLAFHELAG